ncbi:aminotransferase class I/II-fold pyridoxal phosphate-dependent enzyme [Vibrio sp. CB1-14]|uniref:Aminotransferase class I/II-fold pyridoxal phosphate-dependent enzyme n=2 Tax=Vibrionaceae TaxID=641 RepID=A0AAU8BMW6_9VIBR
MRIVENVKPAELDDVRRVAKLIQQDTRTAKYDLVSGILCDDNGDAMVLPTVLESQKRVVQNWGRVPFSTRRFISGVEHLVFGADFCQKNAQQLASVQAPGGTGALRLAFDFFAQQLKGERIWIGTPCWSNYQNVAKAAGLATQFFEHTSQVEVFEQQLVDTKPNDALILQSGAHNPSGSVYSSEEWQQIAQVCRRKQLIPIIDNASQGLGRGVEEDSEAIRVISSICPNLIVATSFSKNFTLYHEQVGALTIKVECERYTRAVQEAMNGIIRSNYSSPSQFGASIVTEILGDDSLRMTWEKELMDVRSLLKQRKHALLTSINNDKAIPTHTVYGVFFQLPLALSDIRALRTRDAIYLLDNGRISLTGLTPRIIENVGTCIRHALLR